MTKLLTTPPDELPTGSSTGSSTLHWRRFIVALGLSAIAALVAIWASPDNSGLAILGVYCIPTNSILPLPHEPGVLYFANFYSPVWIATAATVGSGIAAFIDYATIEAALRYERIRRVQEGRWFRWATRLFMKQPFATICLFAVSPLPVSVVRVLSPAAGYSVWRYVAAMMLGRFPRFYVFAWVGHMLVLPSWVLLVAVMAPLLMLVASSMGGHKETDSLNQDMENEADSDSE